MTRIFPQFSLPPKKIPIFILKFFPFHSHHIFHKFLTLLSLSIFFWAFPQCLHFTSFREERQGRTSKKNFLLSSENLAPDFNQVKIILFIPLNYSLYEKFMSAESFVQSHLNVYIRQFFTRYSFFDISLSLHRGNKISFCTLYFFHQQPCINISH